MKKILLGLMAFMLVSLGGNGSATAKGFSFWHHSRTTGSAYHGVSRPTGHLTYNVFNKNGVPVAYGDLPIGVITNVGTMYMANDSAWPAPTSAAINLLAVEKYCVTGTQTGGPSTAAATDLALTTADAVAATLGTVTVNYIPNAASEKVSCTMNYTGTEAVTEWGLEENPPGSPALGTPWTGGTATTGVATGTPYVASTSAVAGQSGFLFMDTTLACWGLTYSNTTSTVTVAPAGQANGWYNGDTNGTSNTSTCSNSGHNFPQSGDVLKIVPPMLDHMTFAAINVINGDSIQFNFTLSLPSGS